MLFTKFCSSHPFEQYLECTETAMALDALTVEADDDLIFPNNPSSGCFFAMMASSHRVLNDCTVLVR